MAPPYRRYIPPKPSVTPAHTPVQPAKQPPQPVQKDEPKKRKRERSEEEVAERKAKKLRNKGVEPSTAIQQAQEAVKQPPPETKQPAPTNGSADDHGAATVNPEGDYSHVKNTKKRHKLEKEARKARKTAAKDAEAGADSEHVSSGNVHSDADHGQNVMQNDDADLQTSLQAGAVVEPIERKTRRKRKDRHRENGEDGTSHDTTRASKDDEQRRKKDRSHQDESVEIGENAHEDADQDDVSPDQVEDAPLSKPKKRRHKLESVLQDEMNEDAQESLEQDDHLEKHGAVMTKFNKSKNQKPATAPSQPQAEQEERPKATILDLAPLPQPERVPTPEFKPDSSALPVWLRDPTVVSDDARSSFEELNLDFKIVQHLSALGFEDALPVQQALIPLLLPPGSPGARYPPATESVLPDVVVSAPTGSGKTIAYLLPIIESLKRTPSLGRIKALAVVPTRELVTQVAAVADTLARGSGIKIGTATGTSNVKDEQAKLIKAGRRYDPEGYRQLIAKADRWNYPPAQDTEDFHEYLHELENRDAREEKRVDDAVAGLIDHVPTYSSTIDILVATPGRLLEHLGGTLGFGLSHLQWLVLDEADKLLDQQYDGFLETVNAELDKSRPAGEQDARERYLRSTGHWDERKERRVRRVVCSATMTRDVQKLVGLNLSRPRMIVVRGRDEKMGAAEGNDDEVITGARKVEDGFELPPTLQEFCVPAGDGSEKPLILIELLKTKILSNSGLSDSKSHRNWNGIKDAVVEQGAEAKSDSSAESDSSSEVSSIVSSSDSDSDSSSDEDEAPVKYNVEVETAMHPDRAALFDRPRAPIIPTILIFTSSTDSANRLAYLLKTIEPSWTTWIQAMTKSSKPRNTSSTQPIITISTDRAARGLDAIAGRPITHVVQYDVPRSATNYVHRVGRTARVGRYGEGWTLYAFGEARWFMKDIAKGKAMKRKGEVEKVKIAVEDDAMRERFAKAVEEMREEVLAGGGGGKRKGK